MVCRWWQCGRVGSEAQCHDGWPMYRCGVGWCIAGYEYWRLEMGFGVCCVWIGMDMHKRASGRQGLGYVLWVATAVSALAFTKGRRPGGGKTG